MHYSRGVNNVESMLIRALTNADQVIDALGGTSAVAALTGRGLSAVSNWRKSGRIATETFLIFDAALKAKSCKASPALWGLPETVAKPSKRAAAR